MPCQLHLRLILFFIVKVLYLQIAPNPNKGYEQGNS